MAVEVSTDRSRLDVAMVHAFLANQSYWVPGISRANVENCIKHSLCFGVYVDRRQVAFARVVHPDLSTIMRFTLGTQDAQGLYAQFGFTPPSNPERQMELLRPNGAARAAAAD